MVSNSPELFAAIFTGQLLGFLMPGFPILVGSVRSTGPLDGLHSEHEERRQTSGRADLLGYVSE